MRYDFINSKFYGALTYIYYLLMADFLFLIPCFAIVIAILLIGGKIVGSGLIIYFLSTLLLAPAVIALLSVMGKVVRGKTVSVSNQFIKAYVENYLQSILFFTLHSLIIFSLFEVANNITNQNLLIIKLILLGILIYLLLLATFIYPIMSRYYMSSKDLLKLSIYCTAARVDITFKNLLVIIFCAICVMNLSFSGYILPAVVACALMLVQKDFLEELF